MNCEIEFLPVGEGEKAGDAIVIRYGKENDYKLMLVDGGHEETGARIVAHLHRHFGAGATLEHVVLTHSDADHASGLREVLRQVPVVNLWLHVPWLLAEEVRALFKDARWTPVGLLKAIRGDYSIVAEIFDLASAAGTKMLYPFQGGNIGPFRILSPTRWAYGRLLPQFEKTPPPDQAAIEADKMWIGKSTSLARALEALQGSAATWTTESWANERLREGGLTSASNESSVVLYGDFGGGRRVLLTGDAGLNALRWAADYAVLAGLPLQAFKFVQIPHHGSRRNIGPNILNRLVGLPLPEGSAPTFSAFVSAPRDDAKHPRKVVLNAFTRRGGSPLATQGVGKCWPGGFQSKAGYSNATRLPFYDQVEDYT